jgi:hypothetical protein
LSRWQSEPHPQAAGLLTRSQAARVLGVSVSTVIRREHVLKPVIVNGVHMFDERVLRREVTTIRHRQAVASLGPTSGDIASAVFELLEAGIEPTQIVIRVKVPPDAVQALQAQWLEMVRSSKCKRCGEALGVVCRACLVDALDAPCPTCSRHCQDCNAPLSKGKFHCTQCRAWNVGSDESSSHSVEAGAATPENGRASGERPTVR